MKSLTKIKTVESVLTLLLVTFIFSFSFAQESYVDPGYDSLAINVKFIEGSKVRLENNTLVSKTGYDLTMFYKVFEGLNANFWIQPLIDRAVDSLEQEHEQAEAMSGRDIPDLTLIFRIYFDKIVDIRNIIRELNQTVEIVEYATQVPLPAALPSITLTTPDFSHAQGYLWPAIPVRPKDRRGLDIKYAWDYKGGKGKGVKIVDIEYDWIFLHEDISQAQQNSNVLIGTILSTVSPQLQDLQKYRNHGSGVIGILSGDHNQPDNFGVKGIIPDAELKLVGVYWPNSPPSPPYSYDLASSINHAVANTKKGDVILIEQQYYNPIYPIVKKNKKSYLPSEWDRATFDAIVNATASGRIVVEAAGNGYQNLDDPIYNTWQKTNYGLKKDFQPFNINSNDYSGAIMVGAGKPSIIDTLEFTNFGSRIDVHAWGDSIVSTGYGDLWFDIANSSDVTRWYTAFFSGTSGASPMIAGCIVAIQSIRKHENRPLLNAQDMLKLLKKGASRQIDPSNNIGPRPNMRAILKSSINGVFFDDENANGKKDSGEPVRAKRLIYLSGTSLKGNTINKVCITDPFGNYKFEDVVHGNYKIAPLLFPNEVQHHSAQRRYRKNSLTPQVLSQIKPTYALQYHIHH